MLEILQSLWLQVDLETHCGLCCTRNPILRPYYGPRVCLYSMLGQKFLPPIQRLDTVARFLLLPPKQFFVYPMIGRCQYQYNYQISDYGYRMSDLILKIFFPVIDFLFGQREDQKLWQSLKKSKGSL